MYPLYKALHLIGMVAWFAGLFYMFRLFVYHSENKHNKDITDLLKIMEYRLYYYITIPASVFTLVFGILTLIENQALIYAKWFYLKAILLVLLYAYSHMIGKVRKRFFNDDVFLSSKACRIWNEVPTLFLIGIVILAVLKPF